jgi:hypothetical protein
MRAAAFFSATGRTSRKLLLAGLGALGLAVAAGQLHCAEVQSDWSSWDDIRPDGGVKPDGGEEPWRCFTGTPATEDQFQNHCTDAERVERPTNIPLTTWDGKSPLP